MRRAWNIGKNEHFPAEKWSAKDKAGGGRRLIKRLKVCGEKLQKIPKDVSGLLTKVSGKSVLRDRTGKQDTQNPLARTHHSTAKHVVAILSTRQQSQPSHSPQPSPARLLLFYNAEHEAKLHKHPSNFHSLVKTKSSSQWPPNRGCAKQMHKQKIALAIQGLRSWQAHVHTGESSRRGGVWGRMVMGGYTCNWWRVATV